VPEAKEIYERIIQHTPGTNTLAHIHYLRFLRRTEVRSHSFPSFPFTFICKQFQFLFEFNLFVQFFLYFYGFLIIFISVFFG
jgi:hypothetical protein